MLFVDIDEFKNINDTLGHAAGDQLLQAVSTRLTVGLRDADSVGRLGGDEFIVLVDGDLKRRRQWSLNASSMLMSEPLTLAGSSTPIMITATIGIALAMHDNADELLRDSDMALYRAKAMGKNCFAIFQPELKTALRYRLQVGVDLRAALDSGQFRLVYQPIYKLDDLSLTGLEALLRWDHPTRRRSSPMTSSRCSVERPDPRSWPLGARPAPAGRWQPGTAWASTLGISVNVSGPPARRRRDRQTMSAPRSSSSGIRIRSALTIEITETALMRNVEDQCTATRSDQGARRQHGQSTTSGTW